MPEAAITPEEVKDFLTQWAKDYDSGSPKFFDKFAPDASIFTISSPTRIDGRENFKLGFEPYFGKGKRRSQILTPEIQIHGNVVTASFHNRVNIDDRVMNMRTTVVMSRDRQRKLQITHLHQSPLGRPTVGLTQAEAIQPGAISLLEERVATAAAAVGTPK